MCCLSHGCARSYAVLSSTCLCAIDRRWCARSHVTTQESHDAGTNAMELGQQADVECARSHILRSSVVALEHWLCTLNAGMLDLGLLGSSALAGTRCAFWPIPPFKPHFDANDLQHNKTLKLN
jgi:hypothetical protein